MSKTIYFELTTKSINKAIREVKKYQKDILAKFETFKSRLAYEIINNAQIRFNESGVDDLIRGEGTRPAEVSMYVDERGDITVIVAEGEDAVWCEFGAGVYHNTPAGTSPNPYGPEHGFTIGSYGQGKGARRAWGFYDENGELKVTHGTKATMPLYNAVQEVARTAIATAKEVFGT